MLDTLAVCSNLVCTRHTAVSKKSRSQNEVDLVAEMGHEIFFSKQGANKGYFDPKTRCKPTCKQGEFLKILRGKNKDILKDDVGSQNECSFPQIPIMDLEVQTGKF